MDIKVRSILFSIS